MRLKARTIRNFFVNFVLVSLLLGIVFVPLYKEKVAKALKQTGLIGTEITLKPPLVFEYFFKNF